MKFASREYISKIGLGSRAACLDLLEVLPKRLDEAVKQNLIISFLAGLLYDTKDILEENLDAEEVMAAANQTLPAVWLNLTFDIDKVDPANLEPLETVFELVSLGDTYLPIN